MSRCVLWVSCLSLVALSACGVELGGREVERGASEGSSLSLEEGSDRFVVATDKGFEERSLASLSSPKPTASVSTIAQPFAARYSSGPASIEIHEVRLREESEPAALQVEPEKSDVPPPPKSDDLELGFERLRRGDRFEAPYSVLVQILREGERRPSTCSGTLVDPTHVVTAAHCVVHEDRSVDLSRDELTVSAIPERLISEVDQPFGAAQVTAVAYLADYFAPQGGRASFAQVVNDLAVLKIDRPLGSELLAGVASLGCTEDVDVTSLLGSDALVYGFPSHDGFSRASGQLTHLYAGLRDALGIYVGSRRDVRGMSGGGLFIDGQLHGIMSASVAEYESIYASRLTCARRDWVEAYIAATRSAAPRLHPLSVDSDAEVIPGEILERFSFGIHNDGHEAFNGYVRAHILLADEADPSRQSRVASVDVRLRLSGGRGTTIRVSDLAIPESALDVLSSNARDVGARLGVELEVLSGGGVGFATRYLHDYSGVTVSRELTDYVTIRGRFVDPTTEEAPFAASVRWVVEDGLGEGDYAVNLPPDGSFELRARRGDRGRIEVGLGVALDRSSPDDYQGELSFVAEQNIDNVRLVQGQLIRFSVYERYLSGERGDYIDGARVSVGGYYPTPDGQAYHSAVATQQVEGRTVYSAAIWVPNGFVGTGRWFHDNYSFSPFSVEGSYYGTVTTSGIRRQSLPNYVNLRW